MALLDKKDVELLLSAGFGEEDLGLVDCKYSKRGLEIYISPEDYFAKELIENACEQGLCDLYDDFIPAVVGEPYDASYKSLYEDQEYDGNDDDTIDIPQNLRPQVEWLKGINVGKMTLWQKRNANEFKWPVKRIDFDLDIRDKERLPRLIPEYRKELYRTYAREAWQELWQNAVSSLHSIVCETVHIGGLGSRLNLIVIDTDEMRSLGHSVPAEAKWITMLYFEKQHIKPQIRPRNNL
jgi:hypothetical protein